MFVLLGFASHFFTLSNSQIIDEVADNSIISKEEIDKYLSDTLVPYVSQQYGKSQKVNATLNQFMRDVIAAVEKEKLQNEVKQCLCNSTEVIV